MKRYKKELDGRLEVGQVLYTKRFTLTLDRNLCKGCELCRLACPRHAVKLVHVEGRAPVVDIDENKCDFHGICAAVCPFSAIKIVTNGVEALPTVEKQAFPALTRDITVAREKCPPDCKKCEAACPLGIIKVNNEIEIQKELCAGCQLCWMECPEDAISVTKFIEGSIQIDTAQCPAGCTVCKDACPVNAVGVADGNVFANDLHCIYCGACKLACPVKGAIRIERTAIRHSPINSGAWHKGLERLTSPAGLRRELYADNADKARAAVKSLEVEE